MGAPVTKQKNANMNSKNLYLDSGEIKEMAIKKNVIKKGYIKIETTEKLSFKDSPARKLGKTSFFSEQKQESGISKEIKNEEKSNLPLSSNRSDLDLIPPDDCNIINKFMTNPKNHITYKESNLFAKTSTFNINCNFEERFFALEDDIVYLIIMFALDDYYSLIAINSLWYCKINEILDNKFIDIDNLFIQKYLNIFSLKRAYNTFSPLSFNQYKMNEINLKKRFRLDRNLIFDIFPHIKDKSLRIKYLSCFYNSEKDEQCTEYQFDIVSKGPKTIWMFKEEMNYNYDKNKRAFVQSIMPVSEGDNVKIAINLFNLKGLIDIKSIQWEDIIIEEIPQIPKVINEQNIYSLPADRICELETLLDEWIPYEYRLDEKTGELDQFHPYMQLKEAKCCGVGLLAIRSRFQLNKPGKIPNGIEKLGINLIVKNIEDEVLVEVKRKGLAFDLENILEMRVGDYIIFYQAKSIES